MKNFTKIRGIFYSGSHSFAGSNDAINEISFLVDNKYLELQQVSLATRAEYAELLSKETVDMNDEAAGGGVSHIALKLLASNYLKRHYSQSSLFEQSFCGYFPDVISKDHSVVVECGHTQNPDKILIYFRQGGISECIQIPYPGDTDSVIYGYIFTSGPELNEFFDFMEQEKRKEIKRTMSQT